MATLEARLNQLATVVGAEIKALRLTRGDLSVLPTTAKGSLVAALSEVYALAQSGIGVIDDLSGNGVTGKTWSADKIFDHVLASIDGLRTELRAGAGGALDTFAEVAAQLAADQGAAAALATSVANRVRFDAAMTLTLAQKTQARDNISAAEQAALQALSSAVGNTDQDLVAVFNAALV